MEFFKEETIKKAMNQMFSYFASDLALCTTGDTEGKIKQDEIIEVVLEHVADLDWQSLSNPYGLTGDEIDEVKKFEKALDHDERIAFLKEKVFPNASY